MLKIILSARIHRFFAFLPSHLLLETRELRSKSRTTIVITEKIARKYFGDQNPLGQTLHFDHFFKECKITGIVKEFPSNSHFDMDILLSLSSLKTVNFDFNHWQNHTFSTYVLLNQKSKPEDIERRLPQFVQKNLDPYLIQRVQEILR